LCWIKISSSETSFGKPCGSAWGRSSKWAPHSYTTKHLRLKALQIGKGWGKNSSILHWFQTSTPILCISFYLVYDQFWFICVLYIILKNINCCVK
jgi:hypothetical protein